jgi:hypothetical protein
VTAKIKIFASLEDFAKVWFWAAGYQHPSRETSIPKSVDEEF